MQLIRLLLLIACSLAPTLVWAGDSEVIAVIVPRNFNQHSMSTADVSLIFWRKKLYWADGKHIHPVNLSTDQSLRRQFSQVVMGSPPEAQTEYWNEVYFHGTAPPMVVASQEAMLRFVAETPGAIGYIDACKLDNRVKAILWVNEEGTASLNAPSNLNCN